MPSLAEQHELPTDSLSSGVSFMMLLAVAQRGMGFVRTAIFCRLLPEHALGQWSLVFSFVMLTAPLTLMGITGSFGRYVEHYFQRGLIKPFFLRTGAVVALFTSIVLTGIWLWQDRVAWAMFGSATQTQLLLPAALTLLTNILYNYFLESAIALRRIRVGSLMELISSWVFALTAITTLLLTDWGATGVILGFAIGNLSGALFSAACLLRVWNKLPTSHGHFPYAQLWTKLAPFALGLWVVNIIANLFEIVDRYMIIHFSGLDADVAQGLVGQYFSSLAVPLLMVGVSTTLAHLVMPYLSQDWEQGDYGAVADRLNLAVKMLGWLLCLATTGIVCLAPLLFDVVFVGKYAAGFAVLPYTIAFCFWRAIVAMGYNYLYCAEKTRLMVVSLTIALFVNIALNATLLPPLGLTGAALATAISTAVNLALIFYFGARLGFTPHRGVLWVLLFPLVLAGGIPLTVVAFGILVFISLGTNWLFSDAERKQLQTLASNFWSRTLQPILARKEYLT